MRSLEYFDLNAHLWICFFLPFIRKESGTATMKCSSSAYEENPAEYELSPIFIFIICISLFFSPHQDFCRWDCISDVKHECAQPSPTPRPFFLMSCGLQTFYSVPQHPFRRCVTMATVHSAHKTSFLQDTFSIEILPQDVWQLFQHPDFLHTAKMMSTPNERKARSGHSNNLNLTKRIMKTNIDRGS